LTAKAAGISAKCAKKKALHTLRFFAVHMQKNLSDTNSPLILYNTEYKSGGVQKLSGAVFCTSGTVKKLKILYQINGELV